MFNQIKKVSTYLTIVAAAILLSGCKPMQKLSCVGAKPASSSWNTGDTYKKVGNALTGLFSTSSTGVTHYSASVSDSCSFSCNPNHLYNSSNSLCEVIEAAPIVATYIDAPVKGLRYILTNSGTTGVTGDNGHFACILGEPVEFYIGTTVFVGKAPCGPEMYTQFTSTKTDSAISTDAAKEIAVLLLTLNKPAYRAIPPALETQIDISHIILNSATKYDLSVSQGLNTRILINSIITDTKAALTATGNATNITYANSMTPINSFNYVNMKIYADAHLAANGANETATICTAYQTVNPATGTCIDPVCNPLTQYRDQITRQCLNNPTCPAGQYLSGNVCVAEPVCSNDQALNASTHVCDALNCAAGTYASNHVCIADPICANDQILNATTHTCDALNCAVGTYASNHSCVAEPVCTNDQLLNTTTHTCDALNCAPGTHAENHICVADVVVFTPTYSAYGSCSSATACSGAGTQDRTIVSCSKNVNGVDMAGTIADCVAFDIPANTQQACSSPQGQIAGIVITNGTKTVSCAAGSTAQVFDSVQCDLNFHGDGESCISDSRLAVCSGSLPSSSEWNSGSILLNDTYIEHFVSGSWEAGKTAIRAASGDCSYSCSAGYSDSGPVSCIATNQQSQCSNPLALDVVNTFSVFGTGSFAQVWNSAASAYEPVTKNISFAQSSVAECDYSCNGATHSEDGGLSCVSNTKIVACSPLIANATFNSLRSFYEQTWNGSAFIGSFINSYTSDGSVSCGYQCDSGFHTDDAGLSCVADSQPGAICPALISTSTMQFNAGMDTYTKIWNGTSYNVMNSTYTSNAATSCGYQCKAGYTSVDNGLTCAIAGLEYTSTGKFFWKLPVNSNARVLHVSGSNVYASTTKGLAISRNNGDTWKVKTTNDGLGGNDVLKMEVYNGAFYAATIGGLSISNDSGVTWTNKTIASGLCSNSVKDVHQYDGIIYIANGNCVSSSNDLGSTWTNRIVPGTGLVVDTFQKSPNGSFTGWGANTSWGPVRIGSTDGITWATSDKLYTSKVFGSGDNTLFRNYGTRTSLTIEGPGINGQVGVGSVTLYECGDAIFVSGLDVYAVGQDTYNSGPRTVCLSSDGGASWSFNTYAYGVSSVIGGSVMANDTIYVDNSKMYLAQGNGAYSIFEMIFNINTPVQSFTTITGRNGVENIKSMAKVGSKIIVDTDGGEVSSINKGATWEPYAGLAVGYSPDVMAVPGGQTYVTALFETGGMLYADTVLGLSVSSDAGDSWTPFVTQPTTTRESIAVSGTNIYTAGSTGLSVSNNSGVSWTVLYSGANLKKVVASGSIAAFLNPLTSTKVLISTNNGVSFASKTATTGEVNQVAIDGSNGKIYAATTLGLRVTSDNGVTWTSLSGLASSTVNGVYVRNGVIYAATAAGLSISSNNGTTWSNKKVVDGLASNIVNSVYVAADGTVYAATAAGLSIK